MEDKILKSYQFFRSKEDSQQGFTMKELGDAVGWSETTANTYVSKKWDSILEKRGNKFFAVGASKFTVAEYRKLMSQANRNSQDPFKPELDSEVERLVVKAKDCALLALDIYNRPATIFKSEGYIVIMIIAWTSLFHAIFEKNKIVYYYTNDDGSVVMIDGDMKAWELSKCLKEYYKGSDSAVRQNLEFMIGLRNKIEHRFAPTIDNHTGGECQAMLLNFDELLVAEFGDYYAIRDLLAFPLQTANVYQHGRVQAMKKFQGNHYDTIKEYIDVYRSKISDEIYNDPKYSFRVFLVPKTGNHKNSSDLAMEFVKFDPNNPTEAESQNRIVTLIKEKIISKGIPDGLKATDVVKKVTQATEKKFNQHLHTNAWKLFKARPEGEFVKNYQSDYCYSDNVHKDYVYTPGWVEFLIQKVNSPEDYQKIKSYKPTKK